MSFLSVEAEGSGEFLPQTMDIIYNFCIVVGSVIFLPILGTA